MVPGVTGRRAQLTAFALALAIAVGVSPGVAGGAHNIPRDVTLKYSERKDAFKGKIKAKHPACLPGVVVVRRIESGPNPVVASATAGSSGGWSAGARGKRGRYYATTEGYQTPAGNCPSVRSRTLSL
jgi:hypothetical protein